MLLLNLNICNLLENIYIEISDKFNKDLLRKRIF